jgi:hypothetical protein
LRPLHFDGEPSQARQIAPPDRFAVTLWINPALMAEVMSNVCADLDDFEAE